MGYTVVNSMPKKHHHNLPLAFIEKLTQQSYYTLLMLWLSLAACFAVAYFALSVFAPAHGPTQLQEDPTLLIRLLDSFYYSIITATSTGYGDITPQGFSKLLASAQSILALFIFAIFVTKLVSHKQEIALREVHKLTFEDVFHNTREGLYIIRHDCDRIMKHVIEGGQMSPEDWTDMVIAYKQARSLLEEIPDFYAADEEQEVQGLYTIDQQREQLLHEAVHRTLHRINMMLDTLSTHNIDWVSHQESYQELGELVKVVEMVTPLWEKESPYTEAFEDIIELNQSIHGRMQSMIPANG